MEKLEHDLLTTKYTKVYHEKPEKMKFGAPHHFSVHEVQRSDSELEAGALVRKLAEIHFQEGPIKENGVNGVCNEDLIGMVLCRLEYFQETAFNCRENAIAITKLEEALMWLRKRTLGREKRGVEGTNVK